LKGTGRVAMSRNGRCALIGGFEDNRLRLLDLKAGQFLATLGDEQQTFYKGTQAIAVSGDGQFGLSAPRRQELVLWDLKTECVVRRLGRHDDVQSIAFSPDARYAISAGSDSTLRLWDLTNAQCEQTFCGHTAAVRSVAIAPDGGWAISGGDDGTLRLWDVRTGRCLRTLEGRTDGVDSVALSADGRWALSASGKGALHLWDLGVNLATVAKILAPPAVCRVTGIADAYGNKRSFDELLQAAKDAYAREQYAQCDELIRRARSISGYERAREALDVGRTLARHGIRKACRGSWQLGTLGQDSAFAKALALSSDGRFALSAHHYRLMLWDVAGRRLQKLIQTVHGVPNCLALSSDGKWALSSAFECEYVEHTLGDAVRRHRVRLWKLPEGECVRVLDGHMEEIASVAISTDGKIGFSASEGDKTVRIWDLTTGDCLKSIDCEYGPVRALALSPDAQWVLSLDKDGQIDHLLFPGGGFKGLTSPAASIALSPDGRHAVSGNSDGTIQLWDADKGTCVGAFEGHTAAVNALAFSGNGQHVVSASRDGTVRLWDANSGKCRQTMERGGRSIDVLALSADAHLVLCGSPEGGLVLWELDWEYDFPESVDWVVGAETYLKAFLTLRCHIQKERW
jgi:WD40 repeat protein